MSTEQNSSNQEQSKSSKEIGQLDQNTEIVKAEKRQYITAEKKKHYNSFAQLNYDKWELKELGILRPVLKEQMVEIAARTNSEITHRLRNPAELAQMRTTDLAGIAAIAVKNLLDLEQVPAKQDEIDWSKFDADKFDSPNSPKLGTTTPDMPNSGLS